MPFEEILRRVKDQARAKKLENMPREEGRASVWAQPRPMPTNLGKGSKHGADPQAHKQDVGMNPMS